MPELIKSALMSSNRTRQSIFPIVKVMEFLQLLFRKIMLLCFKYPEGKPAM